MPQKPLPACDWPAQAWLVYQKAARVREVPASKTRTSRTSHDRTVNGLLPLTSAARLPSADKSQAREDEGG